MPIRVSAQVLTTASEPSSGSGWLREIKHDGHRVLAFVCDGRLRLLNRNGYDVDARMEAEAAYRSVLRKPFLTAQLVEAVKAALVGR
jgi:bifunctional non-homologous end joining protein LigD